jgi:hypothetical protein
MRIGVAAALAERVARYDTTGFPRPAGAGPAWRAGILDCILAFMVRFLLIAD